MKWYPGNNVCAQDCDESCGGSTCSGIVKGGSVVLSDLPEECCKKHYKWMDNDLCVARSTKTPMNKYYPDLLEGKCVNDSETPTTDLSVGFYETIEDCCVDIHWLTEAECAAASGSSSFSSSSRYFVDWKLQKCVVDSPSFPASKFDDLFDDANDCCARIWWVDEDDCVYEA